MSEHKKRLRQHFRDLVFERDDWKCRKCNKVPLAYEQPLDAHHITNRNLLPFGGYVIENGISLCAECHLKAENNEDGFKPQELYSLINSSFDLAYKASLKLK